MARGGNLCRPHPAGREARRTAGSGADQVRAGGQPQDREGDWGAHPASISAARRRGDRVKRREFITLLAGASVAWPLAVRAQQLQRVQRIGILMGVADDAETKGWLVTFNHRLEQLCWQAGRNLQIDERWTSGDPERTRRFAGELLAMHPDAVFAFSSIAVAALQRESRTVPIVFTAISDPVGSGFAQSLARPGGNATGFTNFVPTMAAKWLEVLKEIAPQVQHAALLFNPETA